MCVMIIKFIPYFSVVPISLERKKKEICGSVQTEEDSAKRIMSVNISHITNTLTGPLLMVASLNIKHTSTKITPMSSSLLFASSRRNSIS